MTDYRESGVDVPEADRGIRLITQQIKKTWPQEPPHQVMIDIGYFANVVAMGDGMGWASTTDGVGSKSTLCEMMDRYESIGIDCVAMNVNDLICVGSRPISMVDYIAVSRADSRILGRIAIGLAEGAHRAGISITGGEVSQLPNIVNGFDLVGTAFGLVPLDRIITGQHIEVGDHIIGIESNGIHSNGLTLARKVLFENNHLDPRGIYPQFGLTLGDELLRPTHIYVPEILELLDLLGRDGAVKALIHITGDGLLNMARVSAEHTGFLINWLPEMPPIFRMIQEYGNLDMQTMFNTFNMGIGFVIIVSPGVSDRVISLLSKWHRRAWNLGCTIRDFANNVYVKPYDLIGTEKSFRVEVPAENSTE